MSRRSLGLLAVLAAVAAPSSTALAAGPANVTVRVEGDAATLVPRTALTTTTTPVTKDGDPAHSCTGTSAAGALEQASGGDWAGTYDTGFRDYAVERVRGERHTFSDPAYWGFFVNGEPANSGVCNTELNAGDTVLFVPTPSDGSPIGLLDVAGVPRTVAPGAPFTVTVTRTRTTYDSSFNPSTARGPAAGVSVGGATTASDGTARITLTDRGPAGIRATGGRDDVRSATEPMCVTDGSDGACGTTAPAAGCATTGDDGLCGTTDRRAPRAKITSVREGQRFARGKGPRTLAGIVAPDPSGIAKVSLRLTRTAAHRRCSTFDGTSERFVRMTRCGAGRGRLFRASASEKWSYLLPTRLPAGRYVLDVRATDRAGNADTLLQRTRTRVVFTVR
jgi:hypothetical protein